MISKIKHNNKSYITYLLWFFGIAVFIFNLVRYYEYTMDDSFIIFRYAENLSTHFQLVFNIDEYPRSEGITSPIWAIVLALFYGINLNILVVAKILGILCTLLSALLIFFITKKIIARYNNDNNNNFIIYSAIASIYFLSDPNVAINSVSGMETSFATFLLLLFFYLILFYNGKLSVYIISIIGILVSLTRPESTLTILITYLLLYVSEKEKRKLLLKSLGIYLAIGIIYFIWRLNYYQMLFPLPFYIKQSKLAGISHLITFLKYNALLIFSLLLLFNYLINKNKIEKSIIVLTIVIIVNLIYLSTIAHIMGFGFRYFQPIYPLVIIISIFSFHSFISFFKIKQITLVLSSFIFIMLLFNIQKFKSCDKIFIDWYIPLEKNIINIGKSLAAIDIEEKPIIGLTDCGAIPYYTKYKTIDFVGLNNRQIAKNFHKMTLLKEIKKNNIDIIIIGSKEKNKYKQLWNRLEQSFFEKSMELGYKLVHTKKIFDNTYYFFFVRNDFLGEKLVKVLNTVTYEYK
jgi:arabinofuranosyltransferase